MCTRAWNEGYVVRSLMIIALIGAFSVIVKIRVIFSNLRFKLYCALPGAGTRAPWQCWAHEELNVTVSEQDNVGVGAGERWRWPVWRVTAWHNTVHIQSTLSTIYYYLLAYIYYQLSTLQQLGAGEWAHQPTLWEYLVWGWLDTVDIKCEVWVSIYCIYLVWVLLVDIVNINSDQVWLFAVYL